MRIVGLMLGVALLVAGCGGGGAGGGVEPTITSEAPTPARSPITPTPDLRATSAAGLQDSIDEIERDIVEGLIDLFPRSCVDESGAFAAAKSLMPQGSSQAILERAQNIIAACRERGIWLGE